MQTYDFYVSTKVNGAMLMKGYAKTIVEAFALLAGENGFATDTDGKLYYLSNVGGTQSIICLTDALNAKIDATQKGAANGVATLGSDGKVPSSQLPAYVDDVIDAYVVSGSTAFSKGWLSETSGGAALTPDAGKIYVVVQSGSAYVNRTYRWSGSTYVEVSSSIVIGTTAGTAYDGAQGLKDKQTMDAHIADTDNPHQVTKAQIGLGNTEDGAKAVKSNTFLTASFTAQTTGGYRCNVLVNGLARIVQVRNLLGNPVAVSYSTETNVVYLDASEPFDGVLYYLT